MSNHIILTGKKQITYRGLRKKVGLQALISLFQHQIRLFYTKGKDCIICWLDNKTVLLHIAYIHCTERNFVSKSFHLFFFKWQTSVPVLLFSVSKTRLESPTVFSEPVLCILFKLKCLEMTHHTKISLSIN